jgi:hypothetical protein
VFEDVADQAVSAMAPQLPAGLEPALGELGALIRRNVAPSALYAELVHLFEERFGPGGRTKNVLDFLDHVTTRRDILEILERVRQHDAQPADQTSVDPDSAPRSPGISVPAVTVLVQPLASDGCEATDGSGLLVLNQCMPGVSGAFARFQGLFPGPDGVGSEVQRWLRECYRDALIVELLPSRHVTTLTAASGGLFPSLAWPSDHAVAPAESSLDIRSLVLRHDPHSASLMLETSCGRPVGVVDLGMVPIFLISCLRRLLLTLCNPWIVRPFRSVSTTGMYALQQGEPAITHVPRDQQGRWVLRRARWLVPARLFPCRERRESDRAYLVRIESWRRAHELPHESFVNVEVTMATALHKERKPRWMSFSNLHALDALQRTVAENSQSTLEFSEALPARHQHWARDCTGRQRASEFLALLRW